jgi:hypothetical protein
MDTRDQIKNGDAKVPAPMRRNSGKKFGPPGYQDYYRVEGNYRPLNNYWRQLQRLMYKWLNRRGQKRSITWKQLYKLFKTYGLSCPRLKARLEADAAERKRMAAEKRAQGKSRSKKGEDKQEIQSPSTAATEAGGAGVRQEKEKEQTNGEIHLLGVNYRKAAERVSSESQRGA